MRGPILRPECFIKYLGGTVLLSDTLQNSCRLPRHGRRLKSTRSVNHCVRDIASVMIPDCFILANESRYLAAFFSSLSVFPTFSQKIFDLPIRFRCLIDSLGQLRVHSCLVFTSRSSDRSSIYGSPMKIISSGYRRWTGIVETRRHFDLGWQAMLREAISRRRASQFIPETVSFDAWVISKLDI